jgi:hypothetical protein
MAGKVPIGISMKLLQHSVVKTTMSYVHINEQMIKDQLINLIGVNKSVKFVVLTNQYLQAMKTVKEKTKVTDYTRPGEPMTQNEFEALIKEAEKGPFMSAEVYKSKFETWKKGLKK